MSSVYPYYPAKLLLFGEYTVLNGSQALAVPLKQYSGRWIKKVTSDPEARESIYKYAEWLQKQKIADQVIEEKIISDFDDGWQFESDIPMGYGIGSSGAFVAAFYDRYFEHDENISKIHAIMAQMECFFHGASSGLDPLISYTQKAVYKDEKGAFHPLADPGWPDGYKIYLLDSGVGRETGPLVQTYKNKFSDTLFAEKIHRQYIPMVEHAIHFYLSGQNKLLEDCIASISLFQLEYFSEMIPEDVRSKWYELISTQGIYVKLCGAGGGGYFMVIATHSLGAIALNNLIKVV